MSDHTGQTEDVVFIVTASRPDPAYLVNPETELDRLSQEVQNLRALARGIAAMKPGTPIDIRYVKEAKKLLGLVPVEMGIGASISDQLDANGYTRIHVDIRDVEQE